MGISCADHVTPLYPQKLALTSLTGGGRSVGIVRSRTKATELVIPLLLLWVFVAYFRVNFTFSFTSLPSPDEIGPGEIIYKTDKNSDLNQTSCSGMTTVSTIRTEFCW